MQHPELGRKILNQVADAVSNVGVVEVYPKQDGRNMIMVLGPDKKAQVQIKKPRTDAPVVQSPVSASVSSPTAPPAVAQPAVVAEAPAAPVTEAPPATVATPHDAV
jgi:translation initiation factor IF-3